MLIDKVNNDIKLMRRALALIANGSEDEIHDLLDDLDVDREDYIELNYLDLHILLADTVLVRTL